MRSPVKQRQKVWFSHVTEKRIGIDTVQEYGKPILKRFTVSPTSGSPDEISAGIVPDYDRYIVSYDRKFKPSEDDVLFVDVEPSLDEDGELLMAEDGCTPITPPDYRIAKLLDTQKGHVARYGISRIGAR